MNRSVRIRLAAFLALSALGISYVAANFLGVVDAVLGRGYSAEVTLPRSGGLFVGSQVSYRGVRVGEVTDLTSTGEGVRVDISLEEGTRVSKDTAVYVHNKSAVGEQYLNLVPEDGEGPYLSAGDVIRGSAASLPVDEGDLLIELNSLVTSIDQRDLNTVIGELGTLFRDTGRPLQRLIDNGTRFINQATANKDETFALLRSALTVLETQADQTGNIRSFARSLNQFTTTLARSDQNLERTLQGTPGAVRQVDALLQQLEPTLPVLLGNLITTNQVVISNLRGVEQLLVTYPAVVAPGFTGSRNGNGYINLQLDQSPQPCYEGFRPPSQWQSPRSKKERPIPENLGCEGSPEKVQRGPRYVPGSSGRASTGRAYRSTTYDPKTGRVRGVVDASGDPVRLGRQQNLSVKGGDSWKWLLVGPVEQQ